MLIPIFLIQAACSLALSALSFVDRISLSSFFIPIRGMNLGPAGSLGRVEPPVFAFAVSARGPRLFCSPADSLCICTASCLPMGISQRPERPFRCLIYRAKLSNVETCDARHIPPAVFHVLPGEARNVPGSIYSSLCRAQRRMRKITLDEIPALQSTTGERIMMPLSRPIQHIACCWPLATGTAGHQA